ncbi:hypothetical protein [Azospirillum sp. sgz302134]
MSILEGSCQASMTFVNNTSQSVTIGNGGYQMGFSSLSATIPAGGSLQCTVSAGQGSDYPGDDSADLDVTFADGTTAQIRFQGQGTSTNVGALVVLGWAVQPNSATIKPAVGALVSTNIFAQVCALGNQALSQLIASAGIIGQAAEALAESGATGVVGDAWDMVNAGLDIPALITSIESNVAMNGATTITLSPS